ncbi:MAG: radical SAM protein [Oscillospiraceae bacterium]|nr:radical SAM protein [Oscillospiraceae bacterium]
MNVKLHITEACNMRCGYCYIAQKPAFMTKETAFAAVDFALRTGADTRMPGIAFFGGEPLLMKELIFETVAYAHKKTAGTGQKVLFKITTNGLLLDDEMLRFCGEQGVLVALSVDGDRKAHDRHRLDREGNGTHERVIAAGRKLLVTQPSAPAMITVNPDTLPFLYESVLYLYNVGFRYLICVVNYMSGWRERDFREFKKQYTLLADFYYEQTMKEEKFYFSPFDVKINSHITNKSYCQDRCTVAQSQVSVGVDGTVYPCVQFVTDKASAIGDVFSGIDQQKRGAFIHQNDAEKGGCEVCAIKRRCNHYCACLNKRTTGDINQVSPALCAHERVIMPIADQLAAKLYRGKSAMFMQKQYNEFYPIISMAEDNLDRMRSK